MSYDGGAGEQARCAQACRAGDLREGTAVFDAPNFGELQRGFNAMVNGLNRPGESGDLL